MAVCVISICLNLYSSLSINEICISIVDIIIMTTVPTNSSHHAAPLRILNKGPEYFRSSNNRISGNLRPMYCRPIICFCFGLKLRKKESYLCYLPYTKRVNDFDALKRL